MNNYTALVDRSKVSEIKKTIEKLGLSQTGVKSEYEEFRYQGSNVNVTYYRSGKLLIQGKGTEHLKEKIFGVEVVTSFTPRIGSDEVGKGDYFGPMVVVSCYVGLENVALLKKLGVDDSKKLSDKKITLIAEEISSILLYEKKVLAPSEYNKAIEKYKNVAIVLAKAHAETLKKLSIKVKKEALPLERIFIDQFSKSKARLLDEIDLETKRVHIEQKHHGESDIAVAAASILARWVFLDEWQKMEDAYRFSFPKGASSVIEQGRVFVDEYGEDKLDDVAKISFRTTKKVLENRL